ncbi:peptide ABC transporter, permease protein [Thermogladius calderae 1633]|uniref:Peptide ABC transporter, permease protein n=1 Tax=Thermogladius calderae (strain DSM 22663 / VKM B-2946 / 1633) TaxID=1184251 RepID=I3TFU1_THEC1|nr:ABC transporter permease [Thermogladius calderae]AFK51629.1 peptide ABC transporter, permease protein [Thermogladius calderae 1633]
MAGRGLSRAVGGLARAIGVSLGLRTGVVVGGFKNALNAVVGSRKSRVGLAVILAYVALAILAPFISPYSPYETDINSILQPPSPQHLFGTDDAGRDLFTENMYAISTSLIVGLFATLVTILVGTVVGLVSGYYGGVVDEVLMRITDFLLIVPPVMLMIVIGSLLGSSLLNIILVIGLLNWSPIARVIRSMVLTVKEWPFVEASRSMGAVDRLIMFKHIFPIVAPVVFANSMLSVANAIFSHAALVFLGVGNINDISWGTILHFAYTSGSFTAGYWWYFTPPGLMLLGLVLGFMLLGVGLEEVYNPKLRSSISV